MPPLLKIKHCLNLSISPGNDDKAYGQCQEVEYLDLRGVDISPECAAEIYARRENKWKKFKVDKTFNVIMELFTKYDVQSFKTDYVSFSPDELDEIKYESYVQSALVLAPGIFSFLCLIVQIRGHTLITLAHFSYFDHLSKYPCLQF